MRSGGAARQHVGVAAIRRLSIAAAVGVLLMVAGLPGSASARPLVTGISGIGDYEPETFQQAQTTGARFVRLVLYWRDIAPKNAPGSWQPEDPESPQYDWSYADLGVTEAVEAGLTPVLQIDGAPLWAQRCRAPAAAWAGELCDPDPTALAAFAKAAASRYSGRIAGIPKVSYWQGLNEPNLTLFFFPQFEGNKPVSPGLYRALLNAFYFAVKSVDPSNIVIAAGLGPLAVRTWNIGPMRFARLLLCMTGVRQPHPTRGDCGGGVHFDVFAIHPYTTGSPTHEGGVNDVELGDLPKLRALLDAADRAGRIKGSFRHTPLWITEFSWDSNPPDPGGLPMAIETRWVAEALYRAWNAGVDHFFWYSLRDDAYDPNRSFSETLQSGLYFRGATIEQDQPKELMYAFRFPFVAYPHKRGLFFWGRTPSSTPGKVAIQLQRGKRWRNALVVHADSHGMFTGRTPTAYGSHKHGAARALYRGEASIPFSMRPVPDFRQPPFG